MATWTTKKLQLFQIHGLYYPDRAADYTALFEQIAGIDKTERFIQRGDEIIALPEIRLDDSIAYLTICEGQDLLPMVYSTASGDTRLQELQQNEYPVTPTHACVDLQTRYTAIEYNKGGAKSTSIADLIEGLAIEHLGDNNLQVHFTPVVGEDFLDLLGQFRRITLANVRLLKPNQNFNHDYVPMLNEVTQKSGGDTIELTISVGRHGSLATDVGGIIEGIRTIVSEHLPILGKARIRGVLQGQEEPTEIVTTSLVEHKAVSVRKVKGGHVDPEDLFPKLADFVKARRRP